MGECLGRSGAYSPPKKMDVSALGIEKKPVGMLKCIQPFQGKPERLLVEVRSLKDQAEENTRQAEA